MKKRVADIIVETLIELGIKNNFCVVGGGSMHLNNAFAINKNIKTLFCHHEQSCAFAAEGYSKLTGEVACVSVTSGPGAANTINGVYSAWVDSTPMIIIAGHPRYDTTIESCGLKIRCRGVQELDVISMVKGITKYAVMLKNPNEVKKEIVKAYNKAVSGRKGPVWISVPLDIQSTIIEDPNYNLSNVIGRDIFSVDDNDIEEVIEIIQKAKRPIILTGTGIRLSGARDSFLKLTQKIKIPIVGGALLSDSLPEGYPLYYGMSGNIGPRTGNNIINNSDCILVLGNSLATRQTGFNVDGFAPNAQIIMVDACEDEMKKPGLRIKKAIVDDLSHFIPCLIEHLPNTIVAEKKWIDYCDNIKTFFENYDDINEDMYQRVPEKYFWKHFRKKIPWNAVIALGNSNSTCGIYQLGFDNIDQRILTNYNAGSMGYDLPAAIGASMGTDSTIICVTGDGSIMMNLQELQTIKHNNLQIKIVIFSNQGYGAIRQTCKNFFNGIYSGCDELSGISFPSFEKIADAFGFNYIHCKNCEELNKKIDEFLLSKDRIILEVDQLLDDPVNPKIMSKIREDGTFETPKFTDLSPFLSESELSTIREYEKKLYEEEKDDIILG